MLRTAVVGTGYLGKFHAHKYAMLPECQLVGVADINEDSGRFVANECGTEFFPDYQQLVGRVDAVSVAVPTILHHKISKDFLSAGVHVLVEKPITTNLDEAYELVQIAREQELILQVGCLERFNEALSGVGPLLNEPRFIESHRLAGFKPRSMDINVVMDLMIHDLDIILSLVNKPLIDVVANGTSVLSDFVDIAQARLTFSGGCVANITASRISQKSKRKMHIFQEKSCICIDFQSLNMSHFYKGDGEMFPGIPNIECDELSYKDSDSLRREIEDFLHCVRHSKAPRVSGEDGHRALELATRISNIIDEGGIQ
ncbi:Gfo/Idh/MocA family protein [Endozoicomonas arenosclerae]|uniref:Gfo/Idh/MocA family protein n=1 Tax=Endozoicomonas arenosclerae TaxID=1633495 RepID=UPI000782F77B|nr:Gfo/Idh/MocA family oxidoreductase [Endozoicomonas arenosclerae]